MSRRISLLEHRLGFPLFERGRTGATLTTAGATFLESAAMAAHELDFAARYAVTLHRGHRGEVRIGVSSARTGVS
uniref:LysR family transcriptional regulator n=1 Tax=Roseixanthobacter psychrophilus TaxID=3119917 RepID=UPI003D1AC50D